MFGLRYARSGMTTPLLSPLEGGTKTVFSISESTIQSPSF